MLLAALATIALASTPIVSNAAKPSGQFQYLLGTGFLCSLPDTPNPCPDIAQADNGDRIELTGQGTFDVNARSVTGGGDFTHQSAGGTVLASGTWSQELLQEDPKAFETLSGPPNADQKAARAQLRELIAATRDYPGVTGRISLDEHRNAVKPAVFLGIENRAYKFVATVER